MPVLIILAVLWAVVLVPPLLRSRSQHTADSIVDFNFKLDVLGRTNGNLEESSVTIVGPDGSPVAPSPVVPAAAVDPPGPMRAPALMRRPGFSPTAAERSARRRREVLRTLAFSVIGTLLLAYAARQPAVWALQIFVDLIAVAYLALWAWMRSVQADRLAKVRYMPDLRVPELRLPEMALRRSASS